MYRKNEQRSISAFLKRLSHLLGHFKASLTINKLILMNLISFRWQASQGLEVLVNGTR